jgi:Zn ribbon nucleic-acid-binding protein
MSGCSSTAECPNCGADNMSVYTDWKPFDHAENECYECGWYSTTKTGFMTLDELNVCRRDLDMDLKPLKELPEQHKDLIWD